MKKAEQLKKAALFTVADINNPGKQIPDDHYFFTESELQEYASEIASEQRGADVKFFSRYLHGSDYAPNKIKNTLLVTDKP